MIADLKFALRQLRKSPGFTFLAVITLALGIGLNTAIFSLINDLFLRGLPFKEPGRVVHMYSNARERKLLELAVSLPRFQHYRDGQTIFDGFGGENAVPFTLTGLGDPVQLFGGKVTSNYFDVLGVRPIRGRNFLPEEEETADVAMVTENFWRKRMGGDPNVIGRSITLDGVPHTIVGVLPNLPFSWAGPNAEIWTTKPLVVPGLSYERVMRGSGFLRVVGRLTGRRREIALRMALGASRASVLRLFIFESLLVSILAGVIGAVLASQFVPLVPRMAANFLPVDPETGVNLSFPVLGFTIALSILTGVAMGIYPALQSSRANLVGGLKEGGRGTSGSVYQQRFRKILVGAQVALSVTLLAGAALLITSFARLSQQNLGFRSQHLWTGAITLPSAQYPDAASRQRFVEQLLNALRDVPGIQNATVSGDIPLNGGNRTLYARGDRDVLPIEQRANAPSHDVAHDFLKSWGIPLLAGRQFNEHDTAD